MPDFDDGSETTTSGDVKPVDRLVARVSELARKAAVSTETPAVDWSSSEGRWKLDVELRSMGVPAAYRRATLDGVQEKARGAVGQYLERLAEHAAAGRGLLLAGGVGTGKSSVAGLVASEAVKLGLSCRWTYVPTLLDDLSDYQTRAESIRLQRRSDVLIWDDFTLAGTTDRQIAQLDRVVEARYSAGRMMVVTTNIAIATLREAEDVARMVDRWREMCLVLRLGGESRRRGPET